MRTHSHESEEPSLRPKSSRLDNHIPAPMMQAAATGRSDVLDPQTVLGLQRAVGNAGVGAMMEEDRSPVHDVVNSGGGSPLAPDVAEEMSTRLGHDFSDVRVHNDSRAHESAKSVNAHAYTVGSNVVFQRDKYDTSSTAGKTMLAHELTHVIQQRSGPVEGTSTGGGIKVSDPSDRFEREAASNADRVMTAPVAAPAAAGMAGTAGPAVQRDEEEEETAQGSFVQRHEEDSAQGAAAVQRHEDSMEGTVAAAVQRDEVSMEGAEAAAVQRDEEEEETAQGSFVQRDEEEEETAQGSFVQRAESEDEEATE